MANVDDRDWEGGPGEGPRDFYLVEWKANGRLRGWAAQDLKLALAKRSGELEHSPRVLHVRANGRKAVVEAWEAGHFDGKDRDMNYSVREGHVRGVESFAELPV